MEEKNKTYTVADFASYHAGTMPANEMHALETAALEDAFLADALEGYAFAESPEKDIIDLKVRLAEKKEKKNVFFISTLAKNKWWNVAALFIIILGAGYLFYRTNKINTKDIIAKNDNKKSPVKVETTTPVLKDSSADNNDIAFEKSEGPGFSTKRKKAIANTNERIDNKKNSSQPALKSAEVSAALSETKDNYSRDSFTIAGSLNKNDTSAAAILQKDKQPNMTMNKSQSDLGDVVVASAYSKKSNKASKPPKTLQGRAA
ncbi:MAG: hypothetical protein M3Z92_01915, partial [Bacteroidota bacterium]|nr:hypothetical protein [Bacteroidota bacterium]